MRIDYNYLGEVLRVFLDSTEPTVTCEDFASLREGDSEKKFAFHVLILADRDLVRGALKDGPLGIKKTGNAGGQYTISVVPWRLTAAGHDFAEGLQKPSVLSALAKVKDLGLAAAQQVVAQLLTAEAGRLISGG